MPKIRLLRKATGTMVVAAAYVVGVLLLVAMFGAMALYGFKSPTLAMTAECIQRPNIAAACAAAIWTSGQQSGPQRGRAAEARRQLANIMAYQFAGFLAPSDAEIVAQSKLPTEAIYRRITTPFTGFGVYIPSMVGVTPKLDEIMMLAVAIGITRAPSWLYIAFDTWAGSTDWMYALSVKHGEQLGPIEDSDEETVDNNFLNVLANIGVDSRNARQFSAFSRGFWEP